MAERRVNIFFQFQQFSGRIVDVFDILYHFPAKLLTPSSTDRALSVIYDCDGTAELPDYRYLPGFSI